MTYRIGLGKYDITGPCAQIGFMGMSNPGQTGKGLLARLFARAFVIEDTPSTRVAIVIADLALCSHAVKAAVVRRLAADPELVAGARPLYDDANLLIAATHTHSGPGGYSHFLAYNASIMGFNKQNFDVIVDGIYRALRKAHDSLRPGKIMVSRGWVGDVGGNRSRSAYEQNPAEERARYLEAVDRGMTLLTFSDAAGKILGTLNWCAAHPTNMGETNHLISGDNKGYAEELMEKHIASLLDLRDWRSDSISAFANSCCGDSSPNMATGLPNGKDDLANSLRYGRHQFDAAQTLLEAPEEELSGPVSFIHRYADLSNVTLEGTNRRTWPPAMGYGMINGSSEDSRGLRCDLWSEGTTRANFVPGFFLPLEAFKAAAVGAGISWPKAGQFPQGYILGHAEKEILFPLGLMTYKGHPIAPSVLPLQIFRIGPLVIVAHPGELTVMSGRRLRSKIAATLDVDERNIVIAAYANAYSSYTATREEYSLQHYEGASTLFGPWTLEAFIQEDIRLAKALKEGQTLPPGPPPVEIPEEGLMETAAYAWSDQPFGSFRPGDVANNLRPNYRKGETVKVTFLGGYPNYDLRTGGTFLAVERKGSDRWPPNPAAVYTDHDSCTSFSWDLASGSSFLTIEWDIPKDDVDSGTYRIRYFGSYKTGLGRKPTPIVGASPDFHVT